MTTYPTEGYPANLTEAQKRADKTGRFIAIYHDGSRAYLVETASDVLPGSTHICTVSPRRIA